MATFEATRDLVPAGGVATHAIRVVFYLDDTGEERYCYAHEGMASLSQWLGSIEILKEDLLTELRGEDRTTPPLLEPDE